MTTAPAEQVLTAGGVLRDRKMATYLAAATLSGIGTFLQAAVLGKQVYDITDSTAACRNVPMPDNVAAAR